MLTDFLSSRAGCTKAGVCPGLVPRTNSQRRMQDVWVIRQHRTAAAFRSYPDGKFSAQFYNAA